MAALDPLGLREDGSSGSGSSPKFSISKLPDLESKGLLDEVRGLVNKQKQQ